MADITIYRRVLGSPLADYTIPDGNFLVYVEVEATKDLSTGSELTVAVPANVVITDCKFRNDTALTSGDGATNWQADLTGGSTETLVDTQLLAQNTKPVWKGHIKTFGVTQIGVTSATGTLNGGTIRATIRYEAPMDAYGDV